MKAKKVFNISLQENILPLIQYVYIMILIKSNIQGYDQYDAIVS